MFNNTNEEPKKIKADNPKDKRIPALKTRKRKIRRVLYECLYCADAEVITKISKKGEEKDYLKKDCGLAECPYHDYFINKSQEDETRLKKLLKIFFKDV